MEFRSLGPEYLILGFKASDAVFMVRRSTAIDHSHWLEVNTVWCDRIGATLCNA